ncbi:MAG: dipeptide epimerase [Bacteroidia bacterium]|nr:dipeptide epimerase [Bacteroidia bacterium]
MELALEPFELKFKRPFVISHGTRSSTPAVLIRLEKDGITGYGEAALPPYYSETTESVCTYIRRHEHLLTEWWENTALLRLWMKNGDPHPAAKAGLEMAFLDIMSRQQGRSLSAILSIPGAPTPPCSVTISAGDDSEIEEIIRQHPGFTLFKMKLNGSRDLERVTLARQFTGADLAVDVNGGWKSVEQALELLPALRNLGVIFAEQPFARGREAESAALRSAGIMPIIADESVRTPDEWLFYADCFDGVNVKLMKSPGLMQSIDLIRTAHQMNKKVLIGCMSESGCGVGAAASLQSMANWVDLDGPLLIKNDPFEGITYQNGKLKVIGKTGTGVERKKV